MSTLTFEPWSTCSISTLFWKTLASKKLNEFQKGRIDLPIKSFYVQNSFKNAQLFFSTESFESKVISVAEMGSNFKELNGVLLLCDTIEEFKGLDRAAEASKIAERNLNVEELNDIYHFVIFAFADVKKFKFYHQIAYPVKMFTSEQISWTRVEESTIVDENTLDMTQSYKVDLNRKSITLWDSSVVKNVPGWILRSILVTLSQKFPGESFTVTSLRLNDSSSRFTVKLPENTSLSGITGWEISPSDPSKVSPVRVTDISAIIDPIQLAKQAGELNLKLMKWRLVPDLDLDVISRTSCLLVGSGTLGCNILRALLVSFVINKTFLRLLIFRVGDLEGLV